MESYYEKPVLMLNNLINDLKIGAEIFEKASAATNKENLKKLFGRIKEKDVEYQKRLENEIKKYDGKLITNQEKSNLNTFLDSLKENDNIEQQNRNLKILEYCMKSEYDIQIDFTKVVAAEIPGETKDVITEQYNEIRDFHAEIKVLIEREVKNQKELGNKN